MSRFAGVSEAKPKRKPAGEILSERSESKDLLWSKSAGVMVEREGFEPPIPVKVWPLSRRLVSTAHAPLRVT